LLPLFCFPASNNKFLVCSSAFESRDFVGFCAIFEVARLIRVVAQESSEVLDLFGHFN
jgi:hypothetical protein